MSKYALESSFIGQRTPKQIKLLLKELKTAKKETYLKSLEFAVGYLSGRDDPDFSKELDPSKARVIFAGLYCILHRASRHEDLSKTGFIGTLSELGFSQEVSFGYYLYL